MPQLGRQLPVVKNTSNSRTTVEGNVYHMDCVVSKENVWVFVARQRLCKYFPAERRIVGGVVSNATRVVLKESR
jgi:hypothetical protein